MLSITIQRLYQSKSVILVYLPDYYFLRIMFIGRCEKKDVLRRGLAFVFYFVAFVSIEVVLFRSNAALRTSAWPPTASYSSSVAMAQNPSRLLLAVAYYRPIYAFSYAHLLTMHRSRPTDIGPTIMCAAQDQVTPKQGSCVHCAA